LALASLCGCELHLDDDATHDIAEFILNLKLPHIAAPLRQYGPHGTMGTHHEHCKLAVARLELRLAGSATTLEMASGIRLNLASIVLVYL